MGKKSRATSFVSCLYLCWNVLLFFLVGVVPTALSTLCSPLLFFPLFSPFGAAGFLSLHFFSLSPNLSLLLITSFCRKPAGLRVGFTSRVSSKSSLTADVWNYSCLQVNWKFQTSAVRLDLLYLWIPPWHPLLPWDNVLEISQWSTLHNTEVSVFWIVCPLIYSPASNQ